MKFTRVMKTVLTGCLALLVFTATAHAQCSNKTSHRTSNRQHRTNSIIDLAVSSHNLSTLVAAVKAAGLVETLSGKGPFTVFAPTNQAFAALPEGTVETLLKPENKDALIKVLTYHVVPGRIESTDLSSGDVASVQGSEIEVQVSSGAVQINNALVVDADNRASNGVVHVIDRVILPPGM